MKKSRFLSNSTSAIAASFVLFTGVAHAGTVTDPQVVVVNGGTSTGYVVTDSIT